MSESQLRDLMEAAVGEPPCLESSESIRRRVTRRRVLEYAAVVVIAVCALIAPVSLGALDHEAGPSSVAKPSLVPTVYVTNGQGEVIPIPVATDTPGKPIIVGGRADGIVISPDGKTAYVTNPDAGTITPVDTVTNTAGKPIKIGSIPKPLDTVGMFVAFTPNGKTAYVSSAASNTVTPVNVATNTAGKSIKVGDFPGFIAVTPDGKTAYVANTGSDTVTPITVASNRAGLPIPTGQRPNAIVIAPDGSTAYVANQNSGTVTPITIATNTPGKPIWIGGGIARPMAITPNGKTVYAPNCPWDEYKGKPSSVTPINTATNTAEKPIRVGGCPGSAVITPNGRIVYLEKDGGLSGGITPINTVTNTAGKSINVGSAFITTIVIAPDGRTAYTLTRSTVTPINIATGKLGKAIHLGGTRLGSLLFGIAITP